jgi:polysaccharide deacetylase family protein (PEP-CTERM system associated)
LNLTKKFILLTFDVEDWFQVENFKEYISFDSWNSRELRVEKNTHTILNLLDSFTFKPKATFFVLGWIAQQLPHLVKEINNRGHEVANHGNLHHLLTKQPVTEIIKDLKQGKDILEDIIGKKIYGYRAPSFAINNEILKIIKETGHVYDSSFNSFSMHGRYGTIDLANKDKKGIATEISDNFYELSISNLTIRQNILPLGGGGYFRLIPFPMFKLGMNQVLKKDQAFLFYSHPWEFDPDQPRVEQASKGFKFRHYTNLDKTHKKFESLIKKFKNLNFTTCINYLEN